MLSMRSLYGFSCITERGGGVGGGAGGVMVRMGKG